MEISFELKESFLNGNVVLFCGAGFTSNFSNSPDWVGLIEEAYENLGLNIDDYVLYKTDKGKIPPTELIRLAENYDILAMKRGKEKLCEVIRREFATFYLSKNTDVWEKLKEIPIHTFITTNYDRAIETLYENKIDSVYFPNVIDRHKHHKKLYKLHGSVDDSSSIIINESDYHRFHRDYKYFINKLYTTLCEHDVVFVGYGLGDPNINFIYNEVYRDYEEKYATGLIKNKAYMLIRKENYNSNLVEYYNHKNIQLIKGEINELINTLHQIHIRTEEEEQDIKIFFEQNTTFLHILQHIAGVGEEEELSVIDIDKKFGYLITWEEQKELAIKLLKVAISDEARDKALDNQVDTFGKKIIVKRILELVDRWGRELIKEKDNFRILEEFIDLLDSSIAGQIRSILKAYLDTNLKEKILHYKSDIVDHIIRYNDQNTNWADYPRTLKALIDFSELGFNNPRYVESFKWALRRTGERTGYSWDSVAVLKANVDSIYPPLLMQIVREEGKRIFGDKVYVFEAMISSGKYEPGQVTEIEAVIRQINE